MGVGELFTEGKDEDTWLRESIERSEIPSGDEFRASGIYVAPDQERVGLSAFADDPQRYPLATPSGKVELAGAACVAAGLSAVPEARVLPADDARPLRLVTPKSPYRVHSQLDDIPWFRERDDRAVSIQSRDASTRGILDGAPVLVTSARGRVRCLCRVTDDILEGVVSLCEGIEPEFGIAGEDGYACDVAGAANVLTSDQPTLPSRGATMHSTFVEVEAEGRRP